jgi:hypothetical protein
LRLSLAVGRQPLKFTDIYGRIYDSMDFFIIKFGIDKAFGIHALYCARFFILVRSDIECLPKTDMQKVSLILDREQPTWNTLQFIHFDLHVFTLFMIFIRTISVFSTASCRMVPVNTGIRRRCIIFQFVSSTISRLYRQWFKGYKNAHYL